MTLGKKIRQLRDERGYSREQVATMLGVSFSALEKWETDKRIPKMNAANSIAKLYGLTADELLDGIAPSALPTLRQIERAANAAADPMSEDAQRVLKIMRDEGLTADEIEEVLQFAVSMKKKSRPV